MTAAGNTESLEGSRHEVRGKSAAIRLKRDMVNAG